MGSAGAHTDRVIGWSTLAYLMFFFLLIEYRRNCVYMLVNESCGL
jgi:hypothetical protein